MNQLDVRGRVAAVTGGASGIGLAIARRLHASGARLSLWDARAEALAAAAPELGGAHTVLADVRDYAAVERARDAALEALGRLDILVTSAGITGPNVPVADYPLDGWRDVLDVNLTGTFHCARAVIAPMRAAGYGRIVTIASVAGKEGNPNAAAYSASKAGVIALTKSLGKELATSGVLVNCVTPAAVETPLFAQMTQAHIDYMKSRIPMNRFGRVEEIAALVAWLCSEECSFSTGAVFDLSGGRSTY
ncbi:MAG: 2-dehydro-3-deoxy-L-rhamnonate dehydrogenase [Candidatus Eremiobacteraeota bacterium]|jgi:3-oxoacyl-[acyl-carrier protein] reductase|nr:2-dehydro-3-deoxy-L-rhamnonate dehydrogenase [Candidatus Eremiobacteraeota bacterium]